MSISNNIINFLESEFDETLPGEMENIKSPEEYTKEELIDEVKLAMDNGATYDEAVEEVAYILKSAPEIVREKTVSLTETEDVEDKEIEEVKEAEEKEDSTDVEVEDIEVISPIFDLVKNNIDSIEKIEKDLEEKLKTGISVAEACKEINEELKTIKESYQPAGNETIEKQLSALPMVKDVEVLEISDKKEEGGLIDIYIKTEGEVDESEFKNTISEIIKPYTTNVGDIHIARNNNVLEVTVFSAESVEDLEESDSSFSAEDLKQEFEFHKNQGKTKEEAKQLVVDQLNVAPEDVEEAIKLNENEECTTEQEDFINKVSEGATIEEIIEVIESKDCSILNALAIVLKAEDIEQKYKDAEISRVAALFNSEEKDDSEDKDNSEELDDIDSYLDDTESE